jgi:hypothetical protein
MDEILKKAAGEAPSLVVQLIMVGLFLRHISTQSLAARDHADMREKTLNDLVATIHKEEREAREHSRAIIEDNTRMQGRTCAIIEKATSAMEMFGKTLGDLVVKCRVDR